MSKPSLTFLPVFALTSIKGRLNFRDSASPYSVDTSLSLSRSSFVAIRTLLTSEGAWLSICVIHFSIFSKEDRSVILQVRMMPTAPLQYACVIFLNLYWPAVSQICNLYLRLPQRIVLILKSTPMVATYESLKLFSQNLVMRLVLPTPLSPIMITFAMKSYLSLFFASYINYNITTLAYGPTLS